MKPGLLLFIALATRVNAASIELSLSSTYEHAPEPLSTEMIWNLDPDEPNPQRQRWILNRQVVLLGLKPAQRKDGRFGVTANSLTAFIKSYVRGPGPWYQDFREFRCESQPESWFAIPEGARRAADAAAKYWEELLKTQKVKLALELEHISSLSDKGALEKGEAVFRDWLKDTSDEWRTKAKDQARAVEWRFYLEAANEQHLCPLSEKRKRELSQKAPPSWEVMMEPPAPGDSPQKFLTRAPARRWNGLFAVRLNVLIGTKSLDGQFLIDSSAPMSVMSPEFLNSQGVIPSTIEVPGPLRHAFFSGGGALARKVRVVLVEMSGYTLPITDFLLADTDIFNPPESVATCCDGILGNDFLRFFSIEFLPGPPSEIKLWPREKFHLSTDAPWIEVALDQSMLPVSSCSMRIERPPKGLGKASISGVRWDTGSENAFEVHVPVRGLVREQGKSAWSLLCGVQGGKKIATSLAPSFPNVSQNSESDKLMYSSRVPGANIGMPVLGRGNFTLDLPHGRLWVSKKSLTEEIRRDESGLELEYIFKGTDRKLRVKAMRPHSPATELLRLGLRPGMLINYVDSVAADELDLWQVRQHLAGVYGDTVQIEWKTEAGIKVAPLKVR